MKKRRRRFYDRVYPVLDGWIAEHDMSYSEFCVEIGIQMTHFNDLMIGGHDPRKATIDKILAFTGLTYEEAFREGMRNGK